MQQPRPGAAEINKKGVLFFVVVVVFKEDFAFQYSGGASSIPGRVAKTPYASQ